MVVPICLVRSVHRPLLPVVEGRTRGRCLPLGGSAPCLGADRVLLIHWLSVRFTPHPQASARCPDPGKVSQRVAREEVGGPQPSGLFAFRGWGGTVPVPGYVRRASSAAPPRPVPRQRCWRARRPRPPAGPATRGRSEAPSW